MEGPLLKISNSMAFALTLCIMLILQDLQYNNLYHCLTSPKFILPSSNMFHDASFDDTIFFLVPQPTVAILLKPPIQHCCSTLPFALLIQPTIISSIASILTILFF